MELGTCSGVPCAGSAVSDTVKTTIPATAYTLAPSFVALPSYFFPHIHRRVGVMRSSKSPLTHVSYEAATIHLHLDLKLYAYSERARHELASEASISGYLELSGKSHRSTSR